ncbi:MAG: DUF3667 domain-containing protein [Saprospiraceae bacterium]|nr:DUF3667 domain-containing protein [Saprospiraceae bacterium]
MAGKIIKCNPLIENVKVCLNCKNPLSDQDLFCHKCGQKADAHLLTVKELLNTFWNSLYNLDNTVFKTLKYIWAPWKLTFFYVEGKRKAFLNPMRLFIITLLFHFAIILSTINISQNLTITQGLYRDYERSKILAEYLTVKNKILLDEKSCLFADSIEHALFKNTLSTNEDKSIPIEFLGLEKYPITKKDMVELTITAVYKKYNVQSFKDKLLVKQYIRVNKDPAGSVNYLVGNFAWGVFLVIIALAGFMKLLYYRRKHHLVEHLVLLMNVHSLCFIINTILIYGGIRLNQFRGNHEFEMNGYFILIPVIILFTSILKYYKQGIFKTLIKFGIIGMMYLLLICIFIVFITLISLLLF